MPQDRQERAALQQTRLLHHLARRLDSDGARAQLIETDISWILLTGDLAYKFKKAVRRDVLDYGSLAAQRVACEEELRLKRRLAPELYLGLASVSGSCSRSDIDGTGPVLEVAVRMRLVAQSALWQARIDAGQLETAEVRGLAALLADFHAGLRRAARAVLGGRQDCARTLEDLDGVAARAHRVLARQATSFRQATSYKVVWPKPCS